MSKSEIPRTYTLFIVHKPIQVINPALEELDAANLRKELRQQNLGSKRAKAVLINCLWDALIKKSIQMSLIFRILGNKSLPKRIEILINRQSNYKKITNWTYLTETEETAIKILISAYSTTYNYISNCKSILPTDDFNCGTGVNRELIFATHVLTFKKVVMVIVKMMKKMKMKVLKILKKLSVAKILTLLICSRITTRIFLPATCLFSFPFFFILKEKKKMMKKMKKKDDDDDEGFENIGEICSDKDIETFDKQWDYHLDIPANNSPVFIDNNDRSNNNNNNDFNAIFTIKSTFDNLNNWESINLKINDDSEDDSYADANIHTENKLVTDDVSSLEKTLLACSWNENLILAYLDDINDGFITDKEEFFIVPSYCYCLITRKDVNNEYYDMHQLSDLPSYIW
ncbi:hypothetical protein HELRODRAFT_179127 [Helobdella robusta]|uniref:Uncharacterized protein n=1 Tax=Helobdella robusta TaxID=6412 RepID=T1FE75_HELRO|nr:hypothetical protein HELRODRAFT_179127 [Helobdella robusta]ESN95657.1 hypothetical protein HELRODRAFT_179127 [Helobdella robusta]